MLRNCFFAVAAAFLATHPGVASGQDEPLYMADVQATMVLPPRWETMHWTDADFKAKASDGSAMMVLFMTPWHVVPTEEAALAWSRLHAERLQEEKATDVRTTRTGVGTRAGRPTAELELEFTLEGIHLVYRACAFPTRAKVVHMATMARPSNARKAEEALAWLVDHLEVAGDREAESLEGLDGTVSGPAGFDVDLPPGWRQPTSGENALMADLAGRTGIGRMDAERCVGVVRPTAGTEPDGVVMCRESFYLPKVDAHSWAGVEPHVHHLFFARSPTKVEPATQVRVGDRPGFLYRPEAPSEAFLTGIAPYDQGTVVAWAIGAKDRAEILERDFVALLQSTRFTGPDGGQAPVGLAGWLSYAFKYRSTDPRFFGPALLFVGLFGWGLVRLARRKPRSLDEYGND